MQAPYSLRAPRLTEITNARPTAHASLNKHWGREHSSRSTGASYCRERSRSQDGRGSGTVQYDPHPLPSSCGVSAVNSCLIITSAPAPSPDNVIIFHGAKYLTNKIISKRDFCRRFENSQGVFGAHAVADRCLRMPRPYHIVYLL